MKYCVWLSNTNLNIWEDIRDYAILNGIDVGHMTEEDTLFMRIKFGNNIAFMPFKESSESVPLSYDAESIKDILKIFSS